MHLSEPTTKIGMKVDPYYQQQKCRAITLVSGGTRFMQIFAEVPWRRGVKWRVVAKLQFSAFRWLFLSDILEIRPALLYSDTQRRNVLVHDSGFHVIRVIQKRVCMCCVCMKASWFHVQALCSTSVSSTCGHVHTAAFSSLAVFLNSYEPT